MNRIFDLRFTGKAFSCVEMVCIEVYYGLFRTAKEAISPRIKGSFATRCGAFENSVEAMSLTDRCLRILPEIRVFATGKFFLHSDGTLVKLTSLFYAFSVAYFLHKRVTG